MQIQRRVTIKSPPELIWDVTTNLRQAKEWAPGFDDYPYISPEWPALGAKAVWRYHAGPFSFDFQLTITESIRGEALQIANRSALGRGLEVFGFEKDRDLTTVDYQASNAPSWLGHLAMPFLNKKLNRQADVTVANLKSHCERLAREAS